MKNLIENALAPPKREIQCFHSLCDEYLSAKEVPQAFKRMAPIHLIAAVTGRKVYLRTSYGNIYLTPFTGMVGKPGTGKSQIIDPLEEIVRKLSMQQKIFVAPSTLTSAGFLDMLADSRREFGVFTKLEGTPTEEERAVAERFHHMSIFAAELGVLTGNYDPASLQLLSVMYDCKTIFEEAKRHFKTKENESASRVIVNPITPMLFGTQPRYMTEFIPLSAWEQGFASRVWWIYASDHNARVRGLFDFSVVDTANLERKILRELERISMVNGEMALTDGAKKFLNDFYLHKDAATAPTHSLLVSGYNMRRTLRLEMYAMGYALGCTEELLITEEHCQIVMDWMLEDERNLGVMLEHTGTSVDSEVMRATYEYIKRHWDEKQQGVTKTDVMLFVNRRGDVHKSEKYMKQLTDIGAVRMAHPTIRGVKDTTREVFFPCAGFTWEN